MIDMYSHVYCTRVLSHIAVQCGVNSISPERLIYTLANQTLPLYMNGVAC